MKSLKVVLIQHKAIANNINMNLELGLKYIGEAKKPGADIVLFPRKIETYKDLLDSKVQKPFIRDKYKHD